MSQRFVSLEEAAEYLGLSPRTIRRFIAAGRLTAYRAGPRLLRIELAELDNMLEPITTVGGAA